MTSRYGLLLQIEVNTLKGVRFDELDSLLTELFLAVEVASLLPFILGI